MYDTLPRASVEEMTRCHTRWFTSRATTAYVGPRPGERPSAPLDGSAPFEVPAVEGAAPGCSTWAWAKSALLVIIASKGNSVFIRIKVPRVWAKRWPLESPWNAAAEMGN